MSKSNDYQDGLRAAAAIALAHYEKLKPKKRGLGWTDDNDDIDGANEAERIYKEIIVLIQDDYSI